MIVAPTEPPSLRAVATSVSLAPESYGADILIRPHPNFGKGWIGVQRKEVNDLVSSITDGRLAMQVQQMPQCLMSVLLIEGKMQWSMDGELMSGWGDTLTKDAMESLFWSIQSTGVHIMYTESLKTTVDWCVRFEQWAKKPEHTSLASRTGPDGDVWGKVGNRQWAKHLLMGFMGVGPKLADAIIDQFGGVPLQWTVTEDQMQQVHGLGPKRIASLFAALRKGFHET